MLIGYMRISTKDKSQSFDMQKNALIEAGVEDRFIFSDRVSGRAQDRPGLNECLKILRPNDTLIIWKLDRLARNLRHLIELMEGFKKDNIDLKILSGAVQMDTTTATGKLMFSIIGMFAEFESNLTSERVKAGMAAARARGKFGGRPRRVTKTIFEMIRHALQSPSTSIKDLASELQISTSIIHRYFQPDGQIKEEGRKLLEQLEIEGNRKND